MPHAASAIRPDTDHPPTYRHFCEAVARAQLAAWLPSGRRVLVDVSGRRAASAELAARAGHTVLRVLEEEPGPGRTGPGAGATRTEPRQGGTGPGLGRTGPGGMDPGPRGRILPLIADSSRLSFLRRQLRGRDHR